MGESLGGDLWEGGGNLFAICMRKMAFTLRSIPRGGTIFRGKCEIRNGSGTNEGREGLLARSGGCGNAMPSKGV